MKNLIFKILKFIGWLIILFVFLFVVRCNLERNKLHAKEYTSSVVVDSLAKTKEKIQPLLPLMVDKDRRLDKFDYKGNEAFMDYTFINYTKKQFSQRYNIKIIEQFLQGKICNDPVGVKFVNYGAILNSNFFGNDGKLISSLKVDKSTCASK